MSNLSNIKIKIEKLHELDSLLTAKANNHSFMAGDFAVQIILETDLTQIGYCTAYKGEMKNHMHKESDEWFVIIEGELKIRIEEVNVILTKGQYFKVPVGVRHSVIAIDSVKFLCGTMPPEKSYITNLTK